MEEYQSLMSKRNLPEINIAAEKLAKKVKEKSGISSIEVNTKVKENEALVKYDLGRYFFLFNFPYAYRQNLGVAQALFGRRQLFEENKWYYTLFSGFLSARYQLHSVNQGHDLVLEKQWNDIWRGLDLSAKLKYTTKNIDINVRECSWTQAIKLIYDLNKPSVLFKHIPELREPNYLYAKLLHKLRTNYINTEQCTANILQSALYKDSLWSFKIGHKRFVKTEESDTLVKSSAKVGYNGVDSPFIKLGGYVRNNYDVLNKGLATASNSLLIEKMFSKGSMRVNDALFLKGMKGVYEYPGAKLYRNGIPELGSEHIGDRVNNGLILQYEIKVSSSKLQSFINTSMKTKPYIYATMGYSSPIDPQCNIGFRNNIRGSTGFGLSTSLKPITFEFYYSLAGFSPKCDKERKFGLCIGIS